MTRKTMTADTTEDTMTYIRRRTRLELVYTGLPYEQPALKERSLGGAIFLVAIEDYCSIDDEIHEDARDFLFPPTADWQDVFDWAVSLTDELDAGWLRDALNRSQFSWDMQRADRLARMSRRQRLRRERKANERKASVEQQQAAVVVRGDWVAVQQPCTADGSRAGDAAAHV
jgi:hypothetical protein